ncbi:MAG: SBBP repeat-containing protein [Flavobacteriales bacterium]|nr:SBBP repeat-containing protein [Flavobacteriales bacterium]
MGTVDFDPGSRLTSAGSIDAFVQKLDASGNFVWARSLGGSSNDWGYSITVDSSGNVYTMGTFQGTADFDPGTGTANRTSAGLEDIYIQKMDSNGRFLWVKSFGNSDQDVCRSIGLDPSGNIITAGSYSGTVDFDPGSGTNNLTAVGQRDVFVQKLDNSGNLLWARSFGGTSNDVCYALSIDPKGQIYTTGYFQGTADFDPGTDTSDRTSNGGADVFVHKMNPSGSLVWARSFGGSDDDIGYSIVVDATGNAYTGGYFKQSGDYDPGSGTNTLTSVGSHDIFVQKLDSSGIFQWARSFGGTSWDECRSIAIDASNNVYTGGYFAGTVDFDPGSDTSNRSSAGNNDVFVHKMSQCKTLFSTDTRVACDSFVWINGVTYTSSNNTAQDTLIGTTGCDSIITLDLTIRKSSSATATFSACDSFTWIDGVTYTRSNNSATYTLPNSNGCDSLITLDLTISTSSRATATVSACDSFTWIDGVTYTGSNNNATFTLPNAAGCDSVVFLDLTIQSVSDITTLVNGSSIRAGNANASYQWLDCSNNYAPIHGATSQTYTATTTGDYAVELTENGCVDTSVCKTITVLGIVENGFSASLSVYPNPTNGAFIIDLGQALEHVDISISNSSGRVLHTSTFHQQQILNLFLNEEPGMYFVTISSGDRKAVVKLRR